MDKDGKVLREFKFDENSFYKGRGGFSAQTDATGAFRLTIQKSWFEVGLPMRFALEVWPPGTPSDYHMAKSKSGGIHGYQVDEATNEMNLGTLTVE